MRKIVLDKEIENQICHLYLKGWSKSKIVKHFNYREPIIKRVLQENNIPIRSVQESNVTKFNINHDFFNPQKQSQDSAYILGFLASDGWVSSTDNCVCIEIQRGDKEILEKINQKLENERPVKDYHRVERNSENSKLYFFSKQIKNDLAFYNIIPRKTFFNFDFMENIDENYLIDYIRGHFDGDGCIKWANGSIIWQIDSTSLKTLQHMQQVLRKYNIETKISLHTEECKGRSRTQDLYRIYFYGFEKAEKLYKLFYSNESILFMQRKKEHFYELLKKYKTHETSVPNPAVGKE